jgi:excisionase family DNA binding protein
MPLISVAKIAVELGCSNQHVYRMIRTGAWPAYLLGPKATRLDLDEILALVKMNTSDEQTKK